MVFPWSRGVWNIGGMFPAECTYLPTCLFRRAVSFAVQGLMMLSEGDTYCAGCLHSTPDPVSFKIPRDA